MAIEGKDKHRRPEIHSNRPHHGSIPLPPGMQGMDDYNDPFLRSIQPNPGALDPKGPANFPITQPAPGDAPLDSMSGENLLRELLRTMRQVRNIGAQILSEIHAQSIASKPIIRSDDITDAGQTLDYTAAGQCDRIMARNKGPNSVWIAFDIDGDAVEAFTSDLSYELQSQESICIPRCLFEKLGCKCASTETGTIHTVAFMATAGNLGLAIA